MRSNTKKSQDWTNKSHQNLGFISGVPERLTDPTSDIRRISYVKCRLEYKSHSKISQSKRRRRDCGYDIEAQVSS